jgi:hypothetical protein
LGRRLITRIPPHHGIRPEPFEQGDDARSIVLELEMTGPGVDWLLDQWARLSRALRDIGYWDDHRRNDAIRMLGLHFQDVFEDPKVADIVTACHSLLPDPKVFWTSCYYLTPVDPNFAADRRRVASLQPHVPEAATAKRRLQTMIRRETTRLKTLKATIIDARTAADRAGAAARSLFADAPATTLLIRYEAAASRELTRSLAELAKLRKESSEPEQAAAPKQSGEPIAPTSGPREVQPNEPGAEASRRRRRSKEWIAKALSGQGLGKSEGRSKAVQTGRVLDERGSRAGSSEAVSSGQGT